MPLFSPPPDRPALSCLRLPQERKLLKNPASRDNIRIPLPSEPLDARRGIEIGCNTFFKSSTIQFVVKQGGSLWHCSAKLTYGIS